jgi:uncharacterized phage protein (TIGR02218 family)
MYRPIEVTISANLTDLEGGAPILQAIGQGLWDGAAFRIDRLFMAPAPIPYSATILPLNPVAYYRLSDSGGNFVDLSGHNNTGMISGTGTTFNVPGLITGDPDGAVQFAGTSNVIISNSPSLQNNVVTCVLWMKALGTSQSANFARCVALNGESASSPGWELNLNGTPGSGIMVVRVDTSSVFNNLHNFPGTPFDGLLHMVSIGVDGNAGTVYMSVDGSAWTTGSFAAGSGISNNSAPFNIGSDSFGGNKLVGIIDEVAIFGGILSSANVANLYTAGLAAHRSQIGTINRFSGIVGSVDELTRSSCKLTVNSGTQYLTMHLPPIIMQPNCVHTLFDAGCGLNKASFAESNSVQAGSTVNKVISLSSKPQGYYDNGQILFTSGPNNGLLKAVKQYFAQEFFFNSPLPFPPNAGDAFTSFPGDDKTQSTCQNKFNNLANFCGFPYVPTPETAI